MAFSNGKPFKKPFYTNIYFCANVVIYWIICILITLFDTSKLWVGEYVEVINFYLVTYRYKINYNYFRSFYSILYMGIRKLC